MSGSESGSESGSGSGSSSGSSSRSGSPKRKKVAKKTSGTKRRSANSRRDPKAPKRASTSFVFFTKNNRSEAKDLLAKSGGDVGPQEVMKKLAELWRVLPVEKRKVYEDMALQDKERYAKETAAYVPHGGGDDDDDDDDESDSDDGKRKKGGKRGKKREKGVGPRRNLTAYLFFCQESRAAVTEELVKKHGSGFKNPMVMAEMGNRWRSMSTEQRKPFEDMAAKDKQRYEAEKAASGVAK